MLYELWEGPEALVDAEAWRGGAEGDLRAALRLPLDRVACASVGFVSGVPADGTPGVSVLAYDRARAGVAERLEAAEVGLLEPTRRDAERVGFVNKNVHRSATDPDLLMLYENWLRREDFVAFNGEAKPPYLERYYEEARPGQPDGFTAFQRVTEWRLLCDAEVRPPGLPR